MRVLLTNNTLGMRAGSELYVYDVALELLRRGHEPIAFSTILGEVAEQMRAATIPVIDDLDDCGAAPDIIHGQHHYETLAASLYYPNTPVINFCHGWLPAEEEPVRSPRVLRYVAVDEVCRDRLVSYFGIDPRTIVVLPNFVDTERFTRRTPLPSRPRRALAFGNHFTTGDQLSIIERVCADAGVRLDVAGLGNDLAVSRPETLLPEYDLVFAKARAALEAMAVGCAVVLAGPRGFGPMVTSENWPRLRRLNFGIRSLSLPVSETVLARQVALYHPADARKVCELVRSGAGLSDTVGRLLTLYDEVIAEFKGRRQETCEAQRAAGRHLIRYASMFKAFSSDYRRTQARHDPAPVAILGKILARTNAKPPAPESGITLSIDDVVREYGVMRARGWLAHVGSLQTAYAVVFMQQDTCVGIGEQVPRPDVNVHLNIPDVWFGFEARFQADDGPVRVLAVMEGGDVFDISSSTSPATKRVLRGLKQASEAAEAGYD